MRLGASDLILKDELPKYILEDKKISEDAQKIRLLGIDPASVSTQN